MKKISFLLTFIGILAPTLWASVDVRVGASANFSVIDFKKIGEVSADLKSGARDEEIKELHKAINRALAGVQYNLYTQVGGAWDIFQVGGELGFGFNAFGNVADKRQWSSVMSLSPRAYFGLDLFLARLTFLAGTTINFQAGTAPLPDNYTSPKVDLGFRLGIGPLMAEFIGAINVVEIPQSLFRVGVGLEFTILGG